MNSKKQFANSVMPLTDSKGEALSGLVVRR